MPSAEQIAIKRSSTSESEPALAAFLRAADDGKEPIPDFREEPGSTFRFIYDCWVRRGGFESGKRRHSVRQIKAWLEENEVRSLETKLAGTTWLQFQDALNLLGLFIEKWTYRAVGNRYHPYKKGDPNALAGQLLEELLPEGMKALLLPERKRQKKTEAKNEAIKREAQPNSFDLTVPSGEAIRELFSNSEVLVTISRERTVIGRDPRAAMTGFHYLMENLFEIDKQDRRKRALIWIIDLGLRNDKAAARGAIYNLHFLAAQFESIPLIDREGAEELYEWLHSNTCIIVGSLKKREIDKIYKISGVNLPPEREDLRWFQSDRLFLESVPGRWLDQPGSEAFGAKQKDLWLSPTITAHLRLDDWKLDHSKELDVRKNLRYLYHGEVTEADGDPKASKARCIYLEEPGSRWSDAYRLAIQAAFDRLGREGDDRISPVSPRQALTQLRESSFAALDLNEFLHLPDLLRDGAN